MGRMWKPPKGSKMRSEEGYYAKRISDLSKKLSATDLKPIQRQSIEWELQNARAMMRSIIRPKEAK